MIGCVGETNPIDHFRGKMRCVRISPGKQYTGDFTPNRTFSADPSHTSNRVVLIYGGPYLESNHVIDLSGNWHPEHTGHVLED